MLRALYDYGIRNGLSIPPGFVKKSIRAYICLSPKGEFLGIEQYKEETQICPDIGSLANGPDKCNPLAEKASIILGDNGKKTNFYRVLLKEGAEFAPNLGICLSVLENEGTRSSICEEANLRKIKDGDRICFKVDGTPIVCDERVQKWWETYRKHFVRGNSVKQDMAQPRCLITGNQTIPLATLPIVNGLQAVGGHSRGEALFCFDKPAFQSYGLKQSANAPVSEDAFSVVKDALNDLLAGSPAMYRREKKRDFNPTAPVFSGLKFLHWYDCQLEPEEDPIPLAFFGIGGDEDEEEEDAPQLSPEEQQENERQTALQKRGEADQLFKGIYSGKRSPLLESQYHILLISGNNGRAMIRRYEHGSYETLQANLKQWNDDLALQDNLGTGEIRHHSLYARLQRLVKHQKKTGKELAEQMKKELAGITPTIVMAIIHGTPLPDVVAVRALAYIRSKMLAPEEKDQYAYLPDGIACQWLKVWLIRKCRMRNEEAFLMEHYDREFPNTAYHCGALMAVYADIQRTAMPEVNAGIVQRYYASASRNPILVLGTLERLTKYHLDKIRKDFTGKYGKLFTNKLIENYENRLNNIYAFFGKDSSHQLPAALNLEDQSYFALGYRQMCTQMNADKNAAMAAKKEDA